jgi:hypothetical protein
MQKKQCKFKNTAATLYIAAMLGGVVTQWPAGLISDRIDRRLVVAFRDMAATSPTYGHYVAWVGTFENILNREEGQYRIKLLHNAARTAGDKPGTGSTDCGYSDLELLRDGTIVATTYVKLNAGPEKHSEVGTRFKLAETDALLTSGKTRSQAASLLLAGYGKLVTEHAARRRSHCVPQTAVYSLLVVPF